MQFPQLVFLASSLAMLCTALPSTGHTQTLSSRRTMVKQDINTFVGIEAIPIKDFLITNLTSTIEETKQVDCLVTFDFTDLNSNTSTGCSQAWPRSNATNMGAPLAYAVCDRVNNGTEFFIWQFLAYRSPKSFDIQLAHEFSDPVHYPPPYNYVEYFAPLNVTLNCKDAAGLYCEDEGPLHAVITSISN